MLDILIPPPLDHGACDSEPERIMHAAMRAELPASTTIEPQHRVGRYRLDFLVGGTLAVEVDGPTHETTEGRAHDRRRDAFMRDRGIRTLRFTAATVTADAAGCARSVRRALGQTWWRFAFWLI